MGGALARRYDFGYGYQTPWWHPSDDLTQVAGLIKLVLTSLTEKDASGVPLPATTFTYYEGQIPNTTEYYKLQLATMDNGLGGRVTFTYEGHTPDGWSHLPRRYRVKQTRTITGVGVGAGIESTIDRTYGYGTGRNMVDSYDYRGHDSVTVEEWPSGDWERTFFYTNQAVNGKTEADAAVLQSRAWRLERWRAGGGAPTYCEETDWGHFFTQSTARFIYKDAVRQYQGNVSRKTVYNWTENYGNLGRTREYSPATAADPYRQTERTFNGAVPDGNHYIVDRLAKEWLYEYNGGTILRRETHYCYDGSYGADGAIGQTLYGGDGSFRGRLTAVRKVRENGTDTVDTTYGYDAYGNRTAMTEYGVYGVLGSPLPASDPRTTTAVYETAYHTFPELVTNPLGHATTGAYDAKWGRPLSFTDPNGGVTDYSYDSFGRLTVVQGPLVNGPAGAYRPETRYQYYWPLLANGRITTQVSTQVRHDIGGPTAVWLSARRYYDGLGRAIQEIGYAEGGGLKVVNTYYEGRALKGKESVPHAASGDGQTFLDGDWAGYAGAATTFEYDELRRPTITTLPDGKTTKTTYADWSSTVIDQNGHGKRFEKDAFGRVIGVTEYTGTDPNLVSYAVTSYAYDALDQLTGVTDAAGNGTAITYDNFGRKLAMADPDMGAWSYGYDPIGTLQWQQDAKGQRTYLSYDALKRLVRKWYPASWTQETITAGASKVTVYDLMELRGAVDADRKAAGLSTGAWTDAAIVAGMGVRVRAAHFTELRSRIHDLWTAAGMGAVPEFTGGAIVAGTRRVKASDLTDLRGWLGQYENSAYGQTKRARAYLEYDGYDGVTQFGRGKRTALWDGCGRQSVWFDQAGRQTKEERVIDGAVYTTQWSYDLSGRVYQLTYPDAEVLTHSYGPLGGLLSQIASSLGVTLVSGVQYNALSLPVSYVLGSGTTAEMRHSYYGPDASGSPYGGLKMIQLQKGADAPLVNRDIGYDFAGNVAGITDYVNAEYVGYTYDELDRLGWATAPAGEGFGYNQIGNIVSKNGVPLLYGDGAHKHAVTSHNGTAYVYDANGCMVSRGTQTIKYDPESRPVRLDAGGTVYRVAYDGDGVRRKRLDAGGTIHYVGAYERNVGNGQDTTETVTKYYSGAFGKHTRLIAFRRAGALYWAGTDHLGGTIRVADANFAPVDQMRYTPFGISRDAGSNLKTDHKFTSQIEDASVGLYWYASRAYDPAIGRFVAPDTIVPGANNPQALNRFSYSYNNPLRYTDPTGHSVDDWVNDDWVNEFRAAHDGADPTAADYAYRILTMAAAYGMDALLGALNGEDYSSPAVQWNGAGPGESIGTDGTVDGWFAAAGTMIPLRQFRLYVERLSRKGLMLIDTSISKPGGSRLFNLHEHSPFGLHVNADIGPLKVIVNRYRDGHPTLGQFVQGSALQVWMATQGAALRVGGLLGGLRVPLPIFVPRYLLYPGQSPLIDA